MAQSGTVRGNFSMQLQYIGKWDSDAIQKYQQKRLDLVFRRQELLEIYYYSYILQLCIIMCI